MKPMSPNDYIRYRVGRRGKSIRKGVMMAFLTAIITTVLMVLGSWYLLEKRKGWEKLKERLRRGS